MSNQKFASYKKVPLVPYLILKKLAEDESEDAQNIWKLLKYTSEDALRKPSLTYAEKMDIVWSPSKTTSERTQDTFNVFLKPLVPSALNTDMAQTQLRIYRYETLAETQMEAILLYEIDVIVNESSCMVEDEEGQLLEKTDVLESLLLEVLSGYDIGVGFNYMRFDRVRGGACLSILNINNSKSTYGRSFHLALKYFDNSKGGGCS